MDYTELFSHAHDAVDTAAVTDHGVVTTDLTFSDQSGAGADRP